MEYFCSCTRSQASAVRSLCCPESILIARWTVGSRILEERATPDLITIGRQPIGYQSPTSWDISVTKSVEKRFLKAQVTQTLRSLPGHSLTNNLHRSQSLQEGTLLRDGEVMEKSATSQGRGCVLVIEQVINLCQYPLALSFNLDQFIFDVHEIYRSQKIDHIFILAFKKFYIIFSSQFKIFFSFFFFFFIIYCIFQILCIQQIQTKTYTLTHIMTYHTKLIFFLFYLNLRKYAR